MRRLKYLPLTVSQYYQMVYQCVAVTCLCTVSNCCMNLTCVHRCDVPVPLDDVLLHLQFLLTQCISMAISYFQLVTFSLEL